MTLYATPAELASSLQRSDLDASTATLVLEIASSTFSRKADTWWEATAATYEVVGGGRTRIDLPFSPVTAVAQVRVNGVVTTGWTLRKNSIYLSTGFGSCGNFPPDLIGIDLTHGNTVVPDDVKGAVLDTAGQAYTVPVGAIVSESIDDWAVRYATASGGLQLTSAAADLAASYRGPLMG